MANATNDYRWQDHVARLGPADVAVIAASVAVLIVMATSAPSGPPHVDPARIATAAADGWCTGRKSGARDDA